MGKKVLVRSRYRQPVVKTTRDWERGKDGKLVELNGFRQFENHHCYMTPMEAAFIVDSDENQMFIDAGLPPIYYYPAGAPLIVDDTKDGALAPPISGKSIATNSPRQAEAARKARAQGEIAILKQEQQARERAAQSPSGATRISAPPGSEDDTANFGKPQDSFGNANGGKPTKISNPDLGDNEETDPPVTFSP